MSFLPSKNSLDWQLFHLSRCIRLLEFAYKCVAQQMAIKYKGSRDAHTRATQTYP